MIKRNWLRDEESWEEDKISDIELNERAWVNYARVRRVATV